MMQVLIALAWGVGTFAIVVGLMSIVTQKFAAVACPTLYTDYNTSTGVCYDLSCVQASGYATYNSSISQCLDLTCTTNSAGYTFPNSTYYRCMGLNLTGEVANATNYTNYPSTIIPSSTTKATTSVYYLQGQLGSTGGGLSTYAPIIIVVGIAMVIFAAFGGKSKKY